MRKNTATWLKASDGIVIIQDMMVKFANTRLAEMWGGSMDEIMNKPFIDYIHPDELPQIRLNYIDDMEGETVPNTYEASLLQKDGGTLNVELTRELLPLKAG